MQEFLIQGQLIHCLLLREVKQPVFYELWIKVSGQLLKFSIDEFALITGLKCVGSVDLKLYKNETSDFKTNCFGNIKKVSKKFLEYSFLSKRWSNEEEAFQMAVLYFIEIFLYNNKSESNVRDAHFNLVCSGDFENFPWGKDLFHATLEFLKSKLSLWKNCDFLKKKSRSSDTRPSSRYDGFPLAFQTWFFECCPALEGGIASCCGTEIPRILRWKVTTLQSWSYLCRNLFDQSAEQLKLCNITPTVEERTLLNLEGLFLKGKRKVEMELEDSEGVNFKTKINKLVLNQSKMFNEFAAIKTFIETEFFDVKNQLVELKSLITAAARRDTVEVDARGLVSSSEETVSEHSMRVNQESIDNKGDENEQNKKVESNANDPTDIPKSDDVGDSKDHMNDHTDDSDDSGSEDKVDPNETRDREESDDSENSDDDMTDDKSERDDRAGDIKKDDERRDGSSYGNAVDERFNYAYKDREYGESSEKKVDEGNDVSKENEKVRQRSKKADSVDSRPTFNLLESSTQGTPSTFDSIEIMGLTKAVDLAEIEAGLVSNVNAVDSFFEKKVDEGINVMQKGENDIKDSEKVDLVDSRPTLNTFEASTQGTSSTFDSVEIRAIDKAERDAINKAQIDAVDKAERDAGLLGKVYEVDEGLEDESIFDEACLNDLAYVCDRIEKQAADRIEQQAADQVAKEASAGQVAKEASAGQVAKEASELQKASLKEITVYRGSPSEQISKIASEFKIPYAKPLAFIKAKENVKCVKKLNPLDDNVDGDIQCAELQDFVDWIQCGLRPDLKKKFYLDNDNMIRPRMDFGVEHILKKSWFYAIKCSGQFLTSSHINVVMYYIRKKAKYKLLDGLRITTTDCLFDDRMCATYVAYTKKKKHDVSTVSERGTVADFIRGDKVLCNTHWKDVDEVLFPIHVNSQKHWILGRLVFKERCIYVYNSMQSALSRALGIEAATKYSVLIPLFLTRMNIYQMRSDIDFNSPAYQNKDFCDPFNIVSVSSLPEQQETDCGVFTLAFAEHLIHNKPIPLTLDINRYRMRLSYLLYRYGMMKNAENIFSDEEIESKKNDEKATKKGKKKVSD
ncbi:uncharacterized protein LOC126680778 isoform X2 [Mercurialis annua]|uniref:uncharacterized protein LOC126680778 isoform X2 n=1 Tax=Mercurialis annua TaxID=3986 RepID=UPI00215E7645|nr:uncharacterized protein LOC126680778 isoform X2 [Mercurialis annua]